MIVKIDSFDHYGRGVSKIHDKACFVIGAMKNEVVEIEIIEEKKNYNVAKVVRYIEKSPDRVEALCPYYSKCGGCHLGEMSYDTSLKLKEANVLSELQKNHIHDFQYLGIVGGTPYHYRNKVVLHSDGKHLGFYKEKSHDLVIIDRCLLVDERINKIISSLPQNQDQMIRISNINDDVSLETDTKGIVSSIGNKKYRVSAHSFFQVNGEMTKKLYDYVYENVKLLQAKNVLDLYCGIGTIGIYIHELVDSVVGVEIVEDAILDANFNKKINHANNISFLGGDVSHYIKDFKNRYDLVIVDPPRCGLKKKVVEEITRIGPKTIIYISCNYSTMIRDFKLLEEVYKVENIKLFDMFPNTYHVECVCVMSRR